MEHGYKDPLPLNWDCPSGLVVRTPYSQGRGHGFSPWLGKIPYAQWPGPKKKKKKKKSPAVPRLQIRTVWSLKLSLLQGLRRGLVMRCSEANAIQFF